MRTIFIAILGCFLAWSGPALAKCRADASGGGQTCESAPVSVTSTQTSVTIAAGNTFQTVLAANANRRGCVIWNTSAHTMYVFFGDLANATTTNSFPIAAGGWDSCNQDGIVLTDAVNVTTSTTGDVIVVNETQ